MQQWTISQLDGVMQQKVDFILQPVIPSSVVGLSRSSKAFLKARLGTRKGPGHFGGLLPVWSTTAFWIPAKPLHPRSMLTYITEVCSRWDALEAAAHADGIDQVPIFSHYNAWPHLHNQCFKSWMDWAAEFCLILHIHLTSSQSTTTFFEHFNIFLQGKCFHNQQDTGNVFQEFVKSRSMGFYVTEINLTR